ncbi:MAG: nitrite reductase small subunit NirD [Gemmataceae bacterium]
MPRYITVCRVGDLPEGGSAMVPVEGRDVALFHQSGTYYAMDDRCPHAGASLSGGHVADGCVTCPWHYWRFRLEDGAWADSPRMRTNVYPVRIQDGFVQLEWPDEDSATAQ